MPVHSTITGSARNLSTSGATPLRQPVKKKTTLKGARRGIGKSMHEFAALKNEELKITEDEQAHRRTALDKITVLESKRESVQHEISILQEQTSGSESTSLRQEAQTVQNEIHELEGRLMELKAKHRHLTNQAEQLENSAASELSSYQGALALVDKEVRTFLRHPPVKQGLGPRNLQRGQDMYSLRPERRTLELAKEQWTTELDTLKEHKTETENERDALIEGSKIWREVIQKIDDFEHLVRSHMKNSPSNPDSTSSVVTSLDTTMHFLEETLQHAESKDWKLLICAIGPELESFRQARTLLAPDEPQPAIRTTTNTYSSARNGATGSSSNTSLPADEEEEEDSDVPHADLLNAHSLSSSPSLSFRPTIDIDYATPPAQNQTQDNGFPTTTTTASATKSKNSSTTSSNSSLKATLRNVALTPEPSASLSTSTRQQSSFISNLSSSSTSEKMSERNGRDTRYSESEDDDPGPDFLLSH